MSTKKIHNTKLNFAFLLNKYIHTAYTKSQ